MSFENPLKQIPSDELAKQITENEKKGLNSKEALNEAMLKNAESGIVSSQENTAEAINKYAKNLKAGDYF